VFLWNSVFTNYFLTIGQAIEVKLIQRLKKAFGFPGLVPWDISEGMNINLLTLRFKGELEDSFLEDYFHSSIGLLRISFILGAIYYSLFTILDWVTMPMVFRELLIIRFGLVIPVIVGVFILSFSEKFQKWWQFAAGFTTLITGLGIVLMTLLPVDLIRTSYYPGMILILIYCYLLIRLRYIFASLTGWLIVGLYGLSLVLIPGVDSRITVINLFFLISANILGMFGGYALEFFTRKDFYHRYLLNLEREKVTQANQELEIRVQEKTHDLEENIKNLEALQNIDKAISSSLELSVSLRIFLQQVVDRLAVDAAAVFLYDAELQELNLACEIGFGFNLKNLPSQRVGEGFAGLVAGLNRPLFVPDIGRDSRFRGDNFFSRADQLRSFYGIPLLTKGKMVGVMTVFHRSLLEPDFEWKEFAETLARQGAIAINSIIHVRELEQMNLDLKLGQEEILKGWAESLEVLGVESAGHIQRTVECSLKIARAMKLTDKNIKQVRLGALLHDLGMLAVPLSVRNKTAELGEEDWRQIRKHPELGVEMVGKIPALQPASNVIRSHHEHWDGGGYPDGLSGNRIPITARIVTAADVWDALRSPKPNRSAWNDSKAADYLRDQSGSLFDPRIVDILLANELREMG
jgi:HD-GYP domain-containing protein (c-di-GMP phosphodiesterase class II)